MPIATIPQTCVRLGLDPTLPIVVFNFPLGGGGSLVAVQFWALVFLPTPTLPQSLTERRHWRKRRTLIENLNILEKPVSWEKGTRRKKKKGKRQEQGRELLSVAGGRQLGDNSLAHLSMENHGVNSGTVEKQCSSPSDIDISMYGKTM